MLSFYIGVELIFSIYVCIELKWSGGWSTGTVGWLSASERGQYLDG